MYEELFHSPDRPFRATPDTKFYFPHDSIESARQTVVRAVVRAEGPVMVLGGAGLGKSLLAQIVADDLAARFDTVRLHAAHLCSRRALLQNILFELHMPYRDMTEGDLRLSILDRLEPSSKHAPEGILIIVDEAHTLPAKLLDELRLVTNFARQGQPRVRLVLIGNLRLEDTFAQPQMESFNQRLAARCYLQVMNRLQTGEYVRHQLSVAGLNPRELITDEAIDTVYAASEGVPRLANQIMDHALVLALTRSQCPLSSALIEEAWADLQQLPAPWHSGTDKYTDITSSVVPGAQIEFGSLDDDEHTDKAANPPVATAAPGSSEVDFTSWTIDESIVGPVPTYPASELGQPETAGAEIEIDENNFFSAFSPADDELAAIAPSQMAAADQAPASGEDVLERPRVVFDASLAFANGRHTTGREFAESNQLAADSFFADRPTDERLLALEDEQAEYDEMGVWENDPPLTEIAEPDPQDGETPAECDEKASCSIPSQLFGDDFEQETLITVADSSLEQISANSKPTITIQSINDVDYQLAGSVRSIDQPAEPVDSAFSIASEQAKQAAEAADYVARIQEYSDSIAQANRQTPGASIATVEDVLAQTQTNIDPLAFGASFDSWSVDVAAVDVINEVAVQNEIEDLVSQLNFAAFAVEPYSVEQISIEPRDDPKKSQSNLVRAGNSDEVYTLHRPEANLSTGEELFNDCNAGVDDDRDLLVVEEELPVAAKSPFEPEQPVTKLAPYSQLFSKLRK